MLALYKRAVSYSLKDRHVVVTFDGKSLHSPLIYLEHDHRMVAVSRMFAVFVSQVLLLLLNIFNSS
jgi:hypothetical protein